MNAMELLNKKYLGVLKPRRMTNEINPQLERLEQTTHRILDVLQSVKTELTEFKTEMTEFKSEMYEFKSDMTEFKSETKSFRQEMHEFRSETEEKFEFMIENIVMKTEFEQAIHSIRCDMATKDQLIYFTDRMDAKFLDFKHDVIESIRHTDKKFLKFAL